MVTHENDRSVRIAVSMAIACIAMIASTPASHAEQAGISTLEQLVSLATQENPHVQAARERWTSASHQIKQNYVPTDPMFTYMNVDSRGFPLYKTSLHTVQIAQPLQFPGKGLLQGDQATRAAHIARLAYEAAVRDVRAQVEVAYYQHALDLQLGGITAAQTAILRQVEQVTSIGYQSSQVTQADFIAAHLAVITTDQQVRTYKLNVENDLTQLNMLTYRRPDEPLVVDKNLELKPVKLSIDELIERATNTRQEILQAALSERSAQTAATLAHMEYLPDYTITYFFDDYLLPSGAPAPSRTEDHSIMLAFNVPIYFWWHQREDVQKSLHDLAAARHDLGSIRNETAAAVTTLYRTALFDSQQAALYRNSLIPIARQGFQVSLVAYQTGKLNFAQLQNSYQQLYGLQVAELQFDNQYLAQRVALEQTIGAPLPQ